MTGFTLAKLAVNITGNPAPLHQTLANVRRSLMGFGPTGGLAGRAFTRTFGRTLGGLVGLGVQVAGGFGAAAVQGLASAVDEATAFTESLNKTKETFRGAADLVIAKSEAMAKEFGVSRREYLDAASALGLMAIGVGKTETEAANLANRMVKLGLDSASLYNTDFATAMTKIQAGLAGQSRPLRTWGVAINETLVKLKAAEMGLGGFRRGLTETEKFTARDALITRGLARANNDMAATFYSPANQAKAFQGNLSNLLQTIGAKLMPAYQELLIVANEMVQAFTESWTKQGSMFNTFATGVVDGVNTLGLVWRNWGNVVKLYGIQVLEGWELISAGAVNAARIVGAGWQYAGNVFATVTSSFIENSKSLFGYLADNWKGLGAVIISSVLAPMESMLRTLKMAGDVSGKLLRGEKVTAEDFDWKKAMPKGPGVMAGLLPELKMPGMPEMPKFKMPELKIPDLLGLEVKKLAPIAEILVGEMAHAGKKARAGADRKREEMEPLPEPGSKSKQHAAFYSPAEFAKHLQVGMFGGVEGQLKRIDKSVKAVEAAILKKDRRGPEVGLAAP